LIWRISSRSDCGIGAQGRAERFDVHLDALASRT
jgi:hypothetical protein